MPRERRRSPRVPGPTAPVYVISVAAELTGLHPQTLRQYDRVGLVSPGRTGGGGRRYSLRDIELLREVAELTASGIGLEGVRRILELEHQVAALRARNTELRHQVAELRAALELTLELAQGAPTQPAGPAAAPGRDAARVRQTCPESRWAAVVPIVPVTWGRPAASLGRPAGLGEDGERWRWRSTGSSSTSTGSTCSRCRSSREWSAS